MSMASMPVIGLNDCGVRRKLHGIPRNKKTGTSIPA